MALQRTCCKLKIAPIGIGVPEELNERLKHRVGQMLVVSFDGYVPSESIRMMIKDYYIGGIVITANNIKNSEQAARLMYDLQTLAQEADHDQPLLIGVETDEISMGPRCFRRLGLSQFPGPQVLAAASSSPVTKNVAELMAKELVALGVNWLIGPSMEIAKDATTPFVTTSRFGDDIRTVQEHYHAFVQGLDLEKIVTTAKYLYYPSEFDSYDQNLLIQKTLAHQEIKSVLLHESVNSQHEDGPTTGKRLVLEYLRRETGFRGLVINDCSCIQPNKFRCRDHAVVHAMQMNSDMVYLGNTSDNLERRIKAVYNAMRIDQLPSEIINAAVNRIELLKSNHVSWARALQPLEPSSLRSLRESHVTLVDTAYKKSTALVRSNEHTINAFQHLEPNALLVLVTPVIPPLTTSSNPHHITDPFEPFGRALASYHNKLRHVPYSFRSGITSIHVTFLRRASAVVFVACTTRSAEHDAQLRALRAVRDICSATNTPLLTMGACDPRDLLGQVQLAETYICTFEYTQPALEAAAGVIFGKREATGVLPIRANGTPRGSLSSSNG